MKKIKVNRIRDFISFAALFVAFIWASNGELLYTNSVAVYYFPYLLCLGALSIELLSKRKIVLSSYLLWRCALLIFFVLTLYYTINFNGAFVSVKSFFLQTIVVFLIGLKCSDNVKNIKIMMELLIAAGLINLIYLVSIADISLISEGIRLGDDTTNESWNANNIGIMAAFGAVLTIFVFYISAKRKNIITILIGIAAVAAFTLCLIVTGSKKSIIIVLVTIIAFVIFSSKSHRIRNFILAFAIFAVALYLIYNVSFLYDAVGHRFEDLYNALLGRGGDGSSLDRKNMIDVGLNAFAQKPLFGHGLGGFEVIYSDISSKYRYSHNNYVEILVSTGVVGFILYYAYFFRMLFAKCISNKNTAFIKAMLVAVLVIDVACVSYYDPFFQYVLCLIMYGIIYSSEITHDNLIV